MSSAKISTVTTPPAALRILHLEDNDDDAGLVRANLENTDLACVITRVETRAAFVAELESGKFDLVLADYQLPDFDGLSALAMVRERWPQIPFILVSGTVGEEQAIDAMKSGATDYVLKERLSRLAPAVRRAMHEVEARIEGQKMEAQFVEAQKMEVVGHLASGVAHDFNNILSVILGYGNLMMSEMEADSFSFKCSEEIQHAAERAVALTRQLLVFSRKQTVIPAVVDLNQVVADTDQMLRRLINEHIDMVILPGAELGHVFADVGHLGQILMNLVVNARDAMPSGGKLTIATSNVALSEREVPAGSSLKPGEYVLLSVSDNGTGMTDEVKARLFQAFFTTKPVGQGTGLGLATCRTIVQQSGGWIEVESHLGQGTMFLVYLPRLDLPLTVSVDVTRGDKGSLPRGTETLLLVEDEPSIRHLAANVLENQGYTVLRANNGQDGLNMARDHTGTSISLVVTDVVMPQMDGKVMAEWLQATYPEIKILFTSGYSDETIADHGVLDLDVDYLPKPYTPSTLIHKVREMLDAHPLP